MKILQIMPEFGLAGAERMAETLVIGLMEEGYNVQVVSLYDYHSDITDNLERHGVIIHYLGKKKGFDIKIFLKLISIFIKEKPDVVHTHRYVCGYALPGMVIARVPKRIHTVHNMAEKESVPKIIQFICYHYFNVIPVSISPIIRQSISSFYKLNIRKIPVVLNGIDLMKCQEKIDYVQREKKFCFLHIGRFSAQKNHKKMVKAFSKLHEKYPDIILKLVGDGPLIDEIKEEIMTYGLEDSVFFLGSMNNVYPVYKTADVFLLPSIYEGMPITLIEAMGFGLPIIASNVGGIPDMLENGVSALLCVPEIDSIVENMELLYLNKSLREKLGTEAKRVSLKFSAKKMIMEYMKIYENE